MSDRTVQIAGQVGDTTTRIAKQVSEGATDFAGKTKETAGSVIDSVRNWSSAREVIVMNWILIPTRPSTCLTPNRTK